MKFLAVLFITLFSVMTTSAQPPKEKDKAAILATMAAQEAIV